MRGVLLAWAVVGTAGGATCYQRQPLADFPSPPPVFDGTPTLPEVAEAVNRTDAVRQLQSNSTQIRVTSMPALPRLSANLALERPRRLRLQANMPLLPGKGVDLGSNDEMFWMRMPEMSGATVYFARHEEYRRQLQRSVLPVDPTWMVEALGLARIDLGGVNEGPTVRQDGNLEVRTLLEMPDGRYTRVMVIDARAGIVHEQQLLGPSGRLLARASARRFEYYADHGCSLPHEVDVRLEQAGGQPLELRLEIGRWAINQLLTADPQLFQPPPAGSDRTVDLSRIRLPTDNVPPPTPADGYAPMAGYGPVYRGMMR